MASKVHMLGNARKCSWVVVPEVWTRVGRCLCTLWEEGMSRYIIGAAYEYVQLARGERVTSGTCGNLGTINTILVLEYSTYEQSTRQHSIAHHSTKQGSTTFPDRPRHAHYRMPSEGEDGRPTLPRS